ncbi:phage portal protein [Lactobacillus sp. S2-2]|uniref:phage portal protein n=1 Tax=Lactobacillus sp. S2-2 TaxID=2692917 RepID=UPI001F1E5529|nr:phage portal protein [Lactobacillus sp. S2-2]MCF6515565.1 phage portal protein [Lactobacillus sp. S2-2]
MEIDTMKKILQNTDSRRLAFNADYDKSIEYYQNRNDITLRNRGESKVNTENKDNRDLVRKADNRASSNYHQLVVDQEASYLASTPPDIDTEDDDLNKKIGNVLGSNFALTLSNLVIDSANAGVAWLHYWIDDKGNFKYGVVPPDQITPIYSSDLTPNLVAVRRTYTELSQEDGHNYQVHEYWTDKEVAVYKNKGNDYGTLQKYDNRFSIFDYNTNEQTGQSNTLKHNLGRIPFIEFDKNRYKRPDLFKYKGYIDIYDMIFNGLINDLQDVQQVIFILTNYNGTSMDEFRAALKEGALKFDSDGAGDNSGVDTLKIDIPTDAKDLALKIANEKIFKFGQSVDPADFLVQNNSSQPALKMLYMPIELKAGITEQYFRQGIDNFVRAIIRSFGKDDSKYAINQSWTRNSIQNDHEQAEMFNYLAAYTSDENLAKNNPFVQRGKWKEELELKADEEVNDSFSNQEEQDKLNEVIEKNNK